MREVETNRQVAVLELRGGTHLVLVPGASPTNADAPFDLMVEDLEATHAEWAGRGLDVSPIETALEMSPRYQRHLHLPDKVGDDWDAIQALQFTFQEIMDEKARKKSTAVLIQLIHEAVAASPFAAYSKSSPPRNHL